VQPTISSLHPGAPLAPALASPTVEAKQDPDDLRPICTETDRRFAHRTLQGDVRFRDVPASHWAYDLVGRAAQEKIVSGYLKPSGEPLGIFKPDQKLVREEAIRIFLEPKEAYGEHWARAILIQSKDLGFGQFLAGKRAEETITRLEFIRLILDRFCIEITDSPIPFRDVPSSGLTHDIVATAYRMGLIKGDRNAGDTARTGDATTRAEALQFITRLIEDTRLPAAVTGESE
jgi:hypothetical protein